MTSIFLQLRKDPRAVTVPPEERPAHPWQIPSTHIPPFVQKLLGLTPTA